MKYVLKLAKVRISNNAMNSKMRGLGTCASANKDLAYSKVGGRGMRGNILFTSKETRKDPTGGETRLIFSTSSEELLTEKWSITYLVT